MHKSLIEIESTEDVIDKTMVFSVKITNNSDYTLLVSELARTRGWGFIPLMLFTPGETRILEGYLLRDLYFNFLED